MHRFFVRPKSIQDGQVTLGPEESRHAQKVLRLQVGDPVEVFDGQGRTYRGLISEMGKNGVLVSLHGAPGSLRELAVQVTLAASVIKPDRMEWMLEKACELGVHAFIPLSTDRSVIRLSEERWEAKQKRWQKIAIESCKQCGLSTIPAVGSVTPFKKIIAEFKNFDLCLIPTLGQLSGPLRTCLQDNPKAQRILVLIGPEGDFAPDEVLAAVGAGAVPVSLGPLVLRSETAALFSLSAIRFFSSTA